VRRARQQRARGTGRVGAPIRLGGKGARSGVAPSVEAMAAALGDRSASGAARGGRVARLSGRAGVARIGAGMSAAPANEAEGKEAGGGGWRLRAEAYKAITPGVRTVSVRGLTAPSSGSGGAWVRYLTATSQTPNSAPAAAPRSSPFGALEGVAASGDSHERGAERECASHPRRRSGRSHGREDTATLRRPRASRAARRPEVPVRVRDGTVAHAGQARRSDRTPRGPPIGGLAGASGWRGSAGRST
jgi:hypothetical protein